jgi:DNA-binding NtrC family response regulator
LGDYNWAAVDAIVAAGGIAAVVAATRCALSVEVTCLGCDVLRCLSAVNARNVDAIAATADGFPAVVSAMRHYTDSTPVQQKGCGALSELCKRSPQTAVPAMIAAGGVDAVVSAMRRHSRDSTVLSCGNDVIRSAVGPERAVRAQHVSRRAVAA